MIKNRSVATIDGPEFIDVKPFNPLISQCTIKVMYIGKNRNGSFIDKNTAIQMANSLPHCSSLSRRCRGFWGPRTCDYHRRWRG